MDRQELMRSIQQLQADNAQATANICQLSGMKDQSLARVQTLEIQISSLKQQLETAQASVYRVILCCLLYWIFAPISVFCLPSSTTELMQNGTKLHLLACLILMCYKRPGQPIMGSRECSIRTRFQVIHYRGPIQLPINKCWPKSTKQAHQQVSQCPPLFRR